MKTFVTGGSGFVGSNLIQRLVSNGQRVRALARSNAARDAILRLGAEPVQGDLSDVETLCAGIAGCETVFHCAAAMEFWIAFPNQTSSKVLGNATAIRQVLINLISNQRRRPWALYR
jgi:uncharacterized protein YbjT (DUF2867 family)